MSTETKVNVQVTRRYTVRPERLFDAWLDPVSAARWFFATASGQMVRAELDPRVGGRFVFVDRRGGQDVEHVGEYLEIDRPRRLVFSFSVDGSPPSRVAIDITPWGGGSELTLTHELPPEAADYAERTEEGWTKMLGALAAALG